MLAFIKFSSTIIFIGAALPAVTWEDWGCLACGNMGSSAGQHNNQYVFFSTVAHNKRNSCQSSPVKGYWLAYGKIGKNTHKYGEDCNTCYNVDLLQAHSSLRSMEGYINFSSFYSAN
jgi:hypothetical protein